MSNIYSYPLICTRGAVIFPMQELIIEVGRRQSVNAVNHALTSNINLVLVTQRDMNCDTPGPDDVFDIATIVRIKSSRVRDDHLKVTFVGIKRCHIVKHYINEGINFVDVEELNDEYTDTIELQVLCKKALNEFNVFAARANRPGFVMSQISNYNGELAIAITDTYAQVYLNSYLDKQEYLEELDVEKRIQMMIKNIYKEKQMEIVEKEINDKVKASLEETQKDFYLREKLKAIKSELDEGEGISSGIEDLQEKVEKEPYPENVKAKAKEEFKHYEMVPNNTGEAGVIRSYLEWLLNVPWYQKTEDNPDLNKANDILEEDHYGLKKPKERILEYLAVKQMTNSLKSPIICLVGPPGVGKTSLAKSVARALDRNFVKCSLGGVKDEAEIRGHRRTYLGSMPGRIIQCMKKAGCTNPVFLLDELDKMSSDFKGDPASAMLEVLDPEQNNQFSDHYLEEPYDLSDVLFIATANYEENIPAALKDRLEIIEISSYTELEKVNIAHNHLVKKQYETNGLKPSQMKLSDDMILYLIRHYTREAGVRQLERVIASLARKSVLAILKEKKRSITITKKLINEWLGHELFDYGNKDKKDETGVVTGLAYTQFGGDVLPVEVNYFKGDGKLNITGQLGEVMTESCHIALDYIKANADKYGINSDIFKNNDIHIHCPEGAVPKDGPSAGVTITTALISALTNRKVDHNLAMTGEVTLRGNVLPIGGLREKSLAAHRSGIKKICIPKANLKDMDEIADVVKENIIFIPCESVDDVLKEALV